MGKAVEFLERRRGVPVGVRAVARALRLTRRAVWAELAHSKAVNRVKPAAVGSMKKKVAVFVCN